MKFRVKMIHAGMLIMSYGDDYVGLFRSLPGAMKWVHALGPEWIWRHENRATLPPFAHRLTELQSVFSPDAV